MSEDNPFKDDSTVVAYLCVDDAHAAIEFYKAAFGATAHVWPSDDGRVAHAAVNVPGGMFYLSDSFPEIPGVLVRSPKELGGTSCSTVINVPDADAAWQRAIDAGGEIIRPLKNDFYGRNGQIRDPFGHLWGIIGPLSEG
jgi:PhnB protein